MKEMTSVTCRWTYQLCGMEISSLTTPTISKVNLASVWHIRFSIVTLSVLSASLWRWIRAVLCLAACQASLLSIQLIWSFLSCDCSSPPLNNEKPCETLIQKEWKGCQSRKCGYGLTSPSRWLSLTPHIPQNEHFGHFGSSPGPFAVNISSVRLVSSYLEHWVNGDSGGPSNRSPHLGQM